MADTKTLLSRLQERFGDTVLSCVRKHREVTLEVSADNLLRTCRILRDESSFRFEMLMDLCGVDYSAYGKSEWQTDISTDTGFSRGVRSQDAEANTPRRFAVVYHLLSIHNNQRMRLRVFSENNDMPIVNSVVDIWNSANWYEREAFDLFGIIFDGHPDMRRILTDYGFIGHPFRKDFPLSGQVEMRYDPEKGRVVYEPVSIEPRVLVPKVIRHDHRYEHEQSGENVSDA